MRKVFASAMLCLLLLLSVGVARCEAQCAVPTMPMVMQSASHADAAMDTGMEHCTGMQAPKDSAPGATAVCDASQCHHHQVLSAMADSRSDVDTQLLQPVVLSLVSPVVVQTRDAVDGLARVPLPLRSPLDQTSSLRV